MRAPACAGTHGRVAGTYQSQNRPYYLAPHKDNNSYARIYGGGVTRRQARCAGRTSREGVRGVGRAAVLKWVGTGLHLPSSLFVYERAALPTVCVVARARACAHVCMCVWACVYAYGSFRASLRVSVRLACRGSVGYMNSLNGNT